MSTDPETIGRMRLWALQELERCQKTALRDPEQAHADADMALCAVLSTAGFAEVVRAYLDVRPKWFA